MRLWQQEAESRRRWRLIGWRRSLWRLVRVSSLGALLLALSGLGALVLGTSVAGACGVDGIPSLSVDGRLVLRNTVYTSNSAADTWTPFIAHGLYPARRPLLFSENRAQVAAALPPTAFKVAWRWHFGDGATARGMAVHHLYRRAGNYIVTVEAYLASGKYAQWFAFDKATLHVR